MVWAPLVGRPADYLPSGTVGQWLPAPCNGGPCARAATRKPTRRGRLGPRAGIPKRTRPNCQKRYSRFSVGCISALQREGNREPWPRGAIGGQLYQVLRHRRFCGFCICVSRCRSVRQERSCLRLKSCGCSDSTFFSSLRAVLVTAYS